MYTLTAKAARLLAEAPLWSVGENAAWYTSDNTQSSAMNVQAIYTLKIYNLLSYILKCVYVMRAGF